LKCWDCGEPPLRRNFPCLNPTERNSVHNLQEASTVGYIGRSMHKINAYLDGRHVDHQSTIVEVEAKIHSHNVSTLTHLAARLSYINPNLVEFKKLKKVNHVKSWLVQLAAWTKRKVTHFISDCELNI